MTVLPHTRSKNREELYRVEHYQSWIDLPRTLDLNINEAVWGHLDRKLNKRQPSSLEYTS